MVGRAIVGALVLSSYVFSPSETHNPLAIVVGLFAFAVSLVLWLLLRLPLRAAGFKAIALGATLCDLAAVATVSVAGLIPLAALPLFLVLPVDELSIRYYTRGAIIGALYALALVSYALLHQPGATTAQGLWTLFWLLALIVVLGGVRGAVSGFTEWRTNVLADKSERNASMAGQLSTLLELSREILEQRDIGDVLSSIAVGVSKIFGFKYVTICFQAEPGGDFQRCVLWGFPSHIVAERTGEVVQRKSLLDALSHAEQVVENCYYTPAEQYVAFKSEIYVGDLPRHAPRAKPGAWHERDSMAFVMTDQRGEVIGYMSVDGPYDGKVPSRETMASMQIFVNMAGLAITNAQYSIQAGERARVEEEARRLQMEFLSDVSHEIRAPLATIQGASSLLRSHGEELAPERRREFLEALHDASHGLTRMVEDLLLLSKLEAGHFRLVPEPVDLLAVVRESVRATLAEHAGAPISLTLPSEPLPMVWADGQRLQQIIVNLVSNALKYSPEYAPVYVEVSSVAGRAQVAVTDEGLGIPEHERAKLFTRFGRLSNAKADSTGLGLYISKSLAQAMEGDLDCDSEAGAGTTFFLTLRFADAKADATANARVDATADAAVSARAEPAKSEEVPSDGERDDVVGGPA